MTAIGETRTLAVVGRMLGLITDILDLSKIDAGHVELETIDYAPLDTVREVLDTLLPVAANKETKLRAVVSRDLGDGVGDAFKDQAMSAQSCVQRCEVQPRRRSCDLCAAQGA